MSLERTWNSKSVSKHLKKSLFDETIEEVCQSNYNTQQSNQDFQVLEKQLEDAKKRRDRKTGGKEIIVLLALWGLLWRNKGRENRFGDIFWKERLIFRD